MQLARLPMALEWQVAPPDWTVGLDGTLRIVAGPRTDLFVDPAGGAAAARRAAAHGRRRGRLPAQRLRDAPTCRRPSTPARSCSTPPITRWVKLALERSPQGEAMIVSVVTRGLSDDANGRVVTGDGVWLRVSRIGAACALHASDDGVRWELVRHFALRRARRPDRRLPGPVAHRRGLHGDLRRPALRGRDAGGPARRLLARRAQRWVERLMAARPRAGNLLGTPSEGDEQDAEGLEGQRRARRAARAGRGSPRGPRRLHGQLRVVRAGHRRHAAAEGAARRQLPVPALGLRAQGPS